MIPGFATVALALFPAASFSPAQGPVVRTEELPGGGSARIEYKVGADGELVRHGEYREYHANGEDAARGEYADGLRTGRWRTWHPNREKWMLGAYRQGLRTGTWRFFHPNGEPWAEGDYEEGWRSGDWTVWSADGEIDAQHSGVYRPAEGTWASGNIRYEGNLLDGIPHGPWLYWWANGAPMLRAELHRGERAGTWRMRHPDGTEDPLLLAGAFDEPLVDPILEPTPRGEEAGADGISAREPLPAEAVAHDAVPDGAEHVELLQRFRKASDPAERAAIAKKLRAADRSIFTACTQELAHLDFAVEADRAWGERLQGEILAPLCGGRSFGWVAGTGEPDVERNRLAALRWRAFWLLAQDREGYWLLDLQIPAPSRGDLWATEVASVEASADDVAVRAGSLLQPPLPGMTQGSEAARALFGSRFGDQRPPLAEEDAQVLDRALAWLARHQDETGRFGCAEFVTRCDPQYPCHGAGRAHHDVGVTGLALLAFLGAGNTLESGPYADAVRRAARWLMEHQEENGVLRTYVEIEDPETGKKVRQYSHRFLIDHAIGTLALCEAAALSTSPQLRVSAQHAVDYALRSRNPYGGWRYSSPPIGANDTVVTTWMLHMLSIARWSGLRVPSEAFQGGLAWIDEVSDPGTGRVGYDKFASPSYREAGVNDHFPVDRAEALTAAALLARLSLGQGPEAPIVAKHADLIVRKLPEWDPDGYGCDMYYWYFGTLALGRMGAKHAKPWQKALRAALLESQRTDGGHAGSWDPVGPWGFAGGRIYATATMALCLEAPFRYGELPPK